MRKASSSIRSTGCKITYPLLGSSTTSYSYEVCYLRYRVGCSFGYWVHFSEQISPHVYNSRSLPPSLKGLLSTISPPLVMVLIIYLPNFVELIFPSASNLEWRVHLALRRHFFSLINPISQHDWRFRRPLHYHLNTRRS
jgi:hypothetical protein